MTLRLPQARRKERVTRTLARYQSLPFCYLLRTCQISVSKRSKGISVGGGDGEVLARREGSFPQHRAERVPQRMPQLSRKEGLAVDCAAAPDKPKERASAGRHDQRAPQLSPTARLLRQGNELRFYAGKLARAQFLELVRRSASMQRLVEQGRRRLTPRGKFIERCLASDIIPMPHLLIRDEKTPSKLDLAHNSIDPTLAMCLAEVRVEAAASPHPSCLAMLWLLSASGASMRVD